MWHGIFGAEIMALPSRLCAFPRSTGTRKSPSPLHSSPFDVFKLSFGFLPVKHENQFPILIFFFFLLNPVPEIHQLRAKIVVSVCCSLYWSTVVSIFVWDQHFSQFALQRRSTSVLYTSHICQAHKNSKFIFLLVLVARVSLFVGQVRLNSIVGTHTHTRTEAARLRFYWGSLIVPSRIQINKNDNLLLLWFLLSFSFVLAQSIWLSIYVQFQCIAPVNSQFDHNRFIPNNDGLTWEK